LKKTIAISAAGMSPVAVIFIFIVSMVNGGLNYSLVSEEANGTARARWSPNVPRVLAKATRSGLLRLPDDSFLVDAAFPQGVEEWIL
jgi:hypothetical protein